MVSQCSSGCDDDVSFRLSPAHHPTDPTPSHPSQTTVRGWTCFACTPDTPSLSRSDHPLSWEPARSLQCDRKHYHEVRPREPQSDKQNDSSGRVRDSGTWTCSSPRIVPSGNPFGSHRTLSNKRSSLLCDTTSINPVSAHPGENTIMISL